MNVPAIFIIYFTQCFFTPQRTGDFRMQPYSSRIRQSRRMVVKLAPFLMASTIPFSIITRPTFRPWIRHLLNIPASLQATASTDEMTSLVPLKCTLFPGKYPHSSREIFVCRRKWPGYFTQTGGYFTPLRSATSREAQNCKRRIHDVTKMTRPDLMQVLSY